MLSEAGLTDKQKERARRVAEQRAIKQLTLAHRNVLMDARDRLRDEPRQSFRLQRRPVVPASGIPEQCIPQFRCVSEAGLPVTDDMPSSESTMSAVTGGIPDSQVSPRGNSLI